MPYLLTKPKSEINLDLEVPIVLIPTHSVFEFILYQKALADNPIWTDTTITDVLYMTYREASDEIRLENAICIKLSDGQAFWQAADIGFWRFVADQHIQVVPPLDFANHAQLDTKKVASVLLHLLDGKSLGTDRGELVDVGHDHLTKHFNNEALQEQLKPAIEQARAWIQSADISQLHALIAKATGVGDFEFPFLTETPAEPTPEETT